MDVDGTPERLRAALQALVVELVDEPDQASVDATVSEGGRTMIFTVRTAPRDVGKVIGKRGATAMAIRGLFESIAARHRVKIAVEIDDGGRRPR